MEFSADGCTEDLNMFQDSDMNESGSIYYENVTDEVLNTGIGIPGYAKKRKVDEESNDPLKYTSSVGGKKCEIRSSMVLENDIVERSGHSKLTDSNLINTVGNDDFVWPWTGVVVNVHRTRGDDGRYVGSSGSKFRDELISKGLNPLRVRPLWNYQGHSGTALVEFGKDWPGLHHGLLFEKIFKADCHGKEEWLDTTVEKHGEYCWLARSDDYNASNIVGENLRNLGDLKTVSALEEDEDRKQEMLLSNLNSMMEVKKRHLEEMESKCGETVTALSKLILENEKLVASYNEEIRKTQALAQAHFEKILRDHERLKSQLEDEKQKLERRKTELEHRQAKNDMDQKSLDEEVSTINARNSRIGKAEFKQRKASQNLKRLAEQQKRQKEECHYKMLQLERKLNEKHQLELEIERLRGMLNVMRVEEKDGVGEMESILESLREKKRMQEELEARNQALINKERLSNSELQEARKVITNILDELPKRTQIGVKRLGELDSKAFLKAMKKMYNEQESEEKSAELSSLWEVHLRDPGWHPFRVVYVDGIEKEVIDEEDEKLRDLKNEFGTEVYHAVVTALMEINEHNPSGRYPLKDLWNYEEDKLASLKEGVSLLLDYWTEVENL